MSFRTLLVMACTVLLVGCAAVPAQPELSAASPANPAAAEAPVTPRSQTLALNESPLPRAGPNPKELRPEKAGHDMEDMRHLPPATKPGENAAISAPRWTPTTVPTTGPATGPAVYTCKMHPDVISARPGQCPKCGMILVQKQAGAPSDRNGHGGHQ